MLGEDEAGNLGFVGIADNERDAGESGQFFGGALGVTAGDENFGGGILRVDFANGIAGLSVGGGGDGAGVDDDELGGLRRSRGWAATGGGVGFDGRTGRFGGGGAPMVGVERRTCARTGAMEKL